MTARRPIGPPASGVRGTLLRLSSGTEPDQIPPAFRARLLSIAAMMLISATVSVAGLFSLLVSALGTGPLGFGASAAIAAAMGVFIIAFDRWVITTVNARWDDLEPIVLDGLYDAWSHRAGRVRSEASTHPGGGTDAADPTADEPRDDTDEDQGEHEDEAAEADTPDDHERDLLRRYDALLMRPLSGRGSLWIRVVVSIPLALLVAHGVDLRIFADEIDKRAAAAVRPAFDGQLEVAKGNLTTQRTALKNADRDRAKALRAARTELRQADARVQRAESFNGCPHPSSPAYKGSVCQREKDRASDAAKAIAKNRTPLTTATEPFKSRIATAERALADIRGHGLDRLVERERGVLADVGLLIDYLDEERPALITYAVIFIALLALDLSIVLIKATGRNDGWDRHRARLALADSVELGHQLATIGVTLPDRGRAQVEEEQAEARHRVASAQLRAAEAEARLEAARGRIAGERAERALAAIEHDHAMRRLREEGSVGASMLRRVRARVMSVFAAPAVDARPAAATSRAERTARPSSDPTTPDEREDPDVPSAFDDGFDDGAMAAVDLSDEIQVDAVPERLDIGETIPGRRPGESWEVRTRIQKGRNAFANGVYTVRRTSDGQPGFLKLYTVPPASAPSTEDNRRLRSRAQNEIRVLEAINRDPLGSPIYLPKLLDRSAPSERRIWTVTELCKGDVHVLGGRGKILLTDVLQLMTDVLRAIESAQHLHGDIKPENILVYHRVEGGMLFRLTDWETAYNPDDGRRDVFQAATPEFAAPDRRADPSIHDDLYALGATVWWLATGHVVGELERIVPRSTGRRVRLEGAQSEQVTEKGAGPSDLLWLAAHRRHRDISGCYLLHELLPDEVPSSFCRLIDRLLSSPRRERAGLATDNVDEVVAVLKKEVSAVRDEVAVLERQVHVGRSVVRLPDRPTPVIDEAWRERYRKRDGDVGSAPGDPPYDQYADDPPRSSRAKTGPGAVPPREDEQPPPRFTHGDRSPSPGADTTSARTGGDDDAASRPNGARRRRLLGRRKPDEADGERPLTPDLRRVQEEHDRAQAAGQARPGSNGSPAPDGDTPDV